MNPSDDRGQPDDREPASSALLPPAEPATRLKRHLVDLGDEDDEEERFLSSGRFGDYELLGVLGRGGTGLVCKAGHAGRHRYVALKVMRAGDLATLSEVRNFRKEAERASQLVHANIVPVYHVGEHDGRPFFTMQLMAGGNLDGTKSKFRESPTRAAELIAKIARAVHHAHSSGILHRDLKPANILLDEKGEPYVADFGLAKKLDQVSLSTQSGGWAGTPSYMAPEQASGDGRALKCEADIFSLGAIFYDLLTGQVPFPGKTLVEVFAKLTSPEPPIPPRDLNRAVSADFERVCLKCLEKDIDARYRSAAEVADDLQLLLDRQRPKHLSRFPNATRAVRWVRRRKVLSAALAASIVAVVALTTTARSVWQAAEQEKQNVLETNGAIASGHAGAVLYQLKDYAERMTAAARDEAVPALLAAPTVTDNPPALTFHAAGFDNIFLERTTGELRAQVPPPHGFIYGRNYEFRDYFRGARALAEQNLAGADISRAFLSESRREIAFGVSAPVMAPDWKGVIIGSLGADSAFGEVMMEASAESGRVMALLGPRDNDREAGPDAPLPSGFTFLVHTDLHHGEEHALDSATAHLLRAAFGSDAPAGHQLRLRYATPVTQRHFRDPIPGYEGDWLAAFAPVGRTGYVVLVETPESSRQHPTRVLAEWLVKRVGIPLAAGLVLLPAAAIVVANRRRKRAIGA